MENSNLVIFSPTGKILKSVNWWFIAIVVLSIIGIVFLIYSNWENIKARFQEKPKAIDTDFSAKITFDSETDMLKVTIQSEQKQSFSMRIYDLAFQEIYKEILSQDEQEFNLNPLKKGQYSCVITNEKKAVTQIFEKK